MGNFQCGFITLLGRPNVGKSTLVNQLVGQKISIVSSVPQTTRHMVRGILTTEQYQMIFVDVPGMHEFSHHLSSHLNSLAKKSLEYCDIVLYVADVARFPLQEEQKIVQLISRLNIPTIVALNKIDRSTDYLSLYVDLCKEKIENKNLIKYFIPISALSGQNVGELKSALLESLPEGDPFYEKDQLTDFSLEFRISDIIREKLFSMLRQELPHAVAVKTEEITDKGNVLYIKAMIYIEKESQKPIVVGKSGERVKQVGILSRKDIEDIMKKKVFLDLTVKVVRDWQSKPRILTELGYSDQ